MMKYSFEFEFRIQRNLARNFCDKRSQLNMIEKFDRVIVHEFLLRKIDRIVTTTPHDKNRTVSSQF